MQAFEVVATFSSEIEAELAHATLAAAGIESFMKLDDAGGMLTSLTQAGVRVLVAVDRLDEARELLTDTARDIPES